MARRMENGALEDRSGAGAAQAPLSSPSTLKQCIHGMKEAVFRQGMMAQVLKDAGQDEFFERREQVAMFLDDLLACDI